MSKHDKKGDFSKAVVLAVVALNVLFTAAVLYVFCRVGNEPTALVAAWFGFTTVEMWTLAGIKRAKVNRGDEQ